MLQTSLFAQIIETDSLLLKKLNKELLILNKEIILDIDFYYSINGRDKGDQLNLEKDEKKIKAITEFLIKNKYATIEIGSHTDCPGNLIYNEKVSARRAKNLTNKILNFADSSNYSLLKARIIPKGYGEFFPLIGCECNNCTKDQHQINNRLVLKLIKNDIPVSSQSLKGRGGKGPSFDPESQVEGKITIQVCVDQDGYVITSRTAFLLEKSTINDEKIIAQTIKAANRWKFKPSEAEIACGTIAYVIKIK